MRNSRHALGFETLTREATVPDLPSSGSVPNWLDGLLLRTGPARFEVGRQSYNHWFDGLAMLYKFSFANGRIGYANRYLRSRSYLEAMETGVISRGEFATNPSPNLLERLLPIRRRRVTDNANVNTSRIGDSFVTLTETPIPVPFGATNLHTLAANRPEKDIPGQLTTAHPQFDQLRRCQYNYLLEFGRTSKYHLYRIDAGDIRQRRVTTIEVQQPAYMHSFGMTEHYLVLTEFPLVVNPLKLLLGGKPFIQNYRWQPERGTVFHIIDKDTGRVVKTARSEPFFAFHHVNAFENDNTVVVDIVAYPDASVIDQLYLDRLRSGGPITATGRLTRFRIDLGGESHALSETISETPLELPRFDHHGRSTRPYRYVYGAGNRVAGDFIDNLVKLDVERGAVLSWHEEDCYPGEPVFVSDPKAETEDHGVVLSVVLNVRTESSFLLILDARTFAEVARAEVPHHIPFGFHGNYFRRT